MNNKEMAEAAASAAATAYLASITAVIQTMAHKSMEKTLNEEEALTYRNALRCYQVIMKKMEECFTEDLTK